jgi:cytochrome c2
VQGEGGKDGPDLSRLSAPGDPISWARRIWNHAAAMEKAAQQKGVSWPEFQGGEMGDLLAYLRGVSAGPAEGPDLLPANPRAGRGLFASKGCAQCHAVRGEGGTAGPDLGRVEGFPRTFTSMVGLLWNHAPRMSKAMRERGVAWPLFSEREMADLVAYLSSVRYFDEPGRVAEGQKVFAEKRCDACHAFNGEKREGPDLGRLRGRFSAARMAYTMWAHGPQMLQKMKARSIPWSLFKGQEMADLIAYLNAAEGR